MSEQEQPLRQPETNAEHPADTIKKSREYKRLVELALTLKREKESLTPEQLKRYEATAKTYAERVKAQLDDLANQPDNQKHHEASDAVRKILTTLEELHAEQVDTKEFRKKHGIPETSTLVHASYGNRTFRNMIIDSLLDLQALGYDHEKNKITNVLVYDNGQHIVIEGTSTNATKGTKMKEHVQKFINEAIRGEVVEWTGENRLGMELERHVQGEISGRGKFYALFEGIQILGLTVQPGGQVEIAYALDPESNPTSKKIDIEDLQDLLGKCLKKMKEDPSCAIPKNTKVYDLMLTKSAARRVRPNPKISIDIKAKQ
jgi:hypothetical protein